MTKPLPTTSIAPALFAVPDKGDTGYRSKNINVDSAIEQTKTSNQDSKCTTIVSC